MTKKEAIQYISQNIEKFYGYAGGISSDEFCKDYVHDAVIKVHNTYSDGDFTSTSQLDRMMWIVIHSEFINCKRRNKVTYTDKETITSLESQLQCWNESKSSEQDEKNYQKILNLIDKTVKGCGLTKPEENYYHLLYRFLYIEGESMRSISRNTGIGMWTLHIAGKKIRSEIEIALREDYEDYKNKDYELIQEMNG